MQLTEVDPADWDARLDALGVTDVYWRHGYVAASAPLAGGEPVLLHGAGDGGDVVFAGVLRADPVDVVTPYGYGGPLVVGAAEALDAWRDAYAEWCARRGVLTTFVVAHPSVTALPGFEETPLAGTVAWPLGGDLEAELHAHHRRLVRRARRAGLVATAHPDPDELDEFVAIYTATMYRNAAAEFYRFDAAYWEALLAGVPLVRVDVRDASGELVAGALGMGADLSNASGELVAGALGMGAAPMLHYHLGAVADAGRGTGASQLALLTLAEYGAAHGYDALHLGGGLGGRDDDLLRYKRRFAPTGLRPARLAKAVHDPAAYTALTGRAATDLDGFFPAYRAP